jgi:PTS system nitrogen regulatory IIA component
MKLTREEVAASLDLPLNTLKRWIRQGRIPIRYSADGVVFRESDLRKWAARQNLAFTPPDARLPAVEKPPEENLVPAMRRGGVFGSVPARDLDTALSAAVALTPAIGDEFRPALLERLREREALTSTGIGRGIALPHPRTPLSEALAAPAITSLFLERPINFGAVDERPVFVMFLLLSTSVKVHLHLLSRLSFCARSSDFVAFLKTAPEAPQLLERIAAFEDRLDRPAAPGEI